MTVPQAKRIAEGEGEASLYSRILAVMRNRCYDVFSGHLSIGRSGLCLEWGPDHYRTVLRTKRVESISKVSNFFY